MTPAAVVYDLNGTLLDPGVLAEPLGGPPDLAYAALDVAIAQAMVATLTDAYVPLRDLLGAALRRRAPDGDVAAALERLASMPPFPEVPDALARLAAAGMRLAVVTQSATAAAQEVLRAAGLLERFEVVLGTDAVGAFKPDPRPYAAVLERLGVPPGDAVLVAAHWWDVAGAKRSGLRTAWVARRERLLLDSVPEPDVRASDVADAAEQILALG